MKLKSGAYDNLLEPFEMSTYKLITAQNLQCIGLQLRIQTWQEKCKALQKSTEVRHFHLLFSVSFSVYCNIVQFQVTSIHSSHKRSGQVEGYRHTDMGTGCIVDMQEHKLQIESKRNSIEDCTAEVQYSERSLNQSNECSSSQTEKPQKIS